MNGRRCMIKGYLMAIDVMLQLGDYQFSVNTAAFSDYRRDTEYRWAAQELIGKLDNLQSIGAGRDAITLQGVVYPHYRGGLGQIESMRAEASKGKPLLLVDGLGNIMGRFIIEKIEETRAVFSAGGVPLRQGFAINLRRFDNGANL